MSRTEILASLPWIVAAIGLLVTHFLSEARERRKEVRAQIEKLVERLAVLELRGIKFHTAATFDVAEARAIEVEIASIERRAVRLVGDGASSLVDAAIAHRQSLTLGNFEPSAFVSQPPGSELLAEIGAATGSYEEALEAAYQLQYPAHFPYYKLGAQGAPTGMWGPIVAFWVGLLIGGTAVYLSMLR